MTTIDRHRLSRRSAQKLWEWTRRYLPNEIAGTICEMGGAAGAYRATGSLETAAMAATVGAAIGYYASAFYAAFMISLRTRCGGPVAARIGGACLLASRSLAIEFGPAEILDTLIVRPLAFYFGPLIFGGLAAGWIFAKLVADVAFHAVTITSYEHFKGLLAIHRATTMEVITGERIAPHAAA